MTRMHRFVVSAGRTLPDDRTLAGRRAYDHRLRVHAESLVGTVHGVVHTVLNLNPISTGASALAGAGLGAVDSWVLGGARAALRETADVIGRTTSPQLDSTWFSATYWRVAGLAALLTLPFLFAAAVQALVRSDLGLLARAAFCYLPLAAIGVGLAAPLTMLLLAATDQMCAVVSAAGSGGGATFLAEAALAAGGTSALDGSAFLAFAIGLFTVAGAITLAIEMLIREAAVYVVVLMLPLAFAAFVWPARRAWALRALELLVALILSKFAVVAVLSLAGAAYGTSGDGPARLLTAMALVTLAAFAPWGLLRLLPFTELAAGAAGEIHSALPKTPNPAAALATGAPAAGVASGDWAESIPAMMADQARHAGQAGDRASGNGTGIPDADLLGVVGAHPSGGVRSAGDAGGAAAADVHGGAGSDPGVGGVGPAGDSTDLPGAAGFSPGAGGAETADGSGGAAGGDRSGAGNGDSDPNLVAEDIGLDSAGSGGPSGNRLPGLGAAWQADNWTWKPIHLGLGDEWPPTLGPPADTPAESDRPAQEDNPLPPAQPHNDPLEPGGPLDDTPPTQPEQDGPR